LNEPGDDLAAYVEEHYAIQRRVYALATLRAGAARVDVAYAFLERPLERLRRFLRPVPLVAQAEELVDPVGNSEAARLLAP